MISNKPQYTFKSAALHVLKEAGEPLHVREITNRALALGIIQTRGATPDATMAAIIVTDINLLGERSAFVKTAPSTYAANTHISVDESNNIDAQVEYARRNAIHASVSSRQKGDIAEARVAELITLYGDSGLSCYKPISDDEGIDIIVKQRGNLKTLYLQVKSRWQDDTKELIADVKKSGLVDSYAMGVIICRFDIEKGDLGDFLWYIPAPDFIRLANNPQEKSTYRFRTRKQSNVWEPYLIDKRDLANRLIEQMGRI